jgi:hypothetical protein
MYTRTLADGIAFSSWHKVFDDVIAGSLEDEYPGGTTGLLDINGNPKPSYYAYQTMTEALNGAKYIRELQATNAEGYLFKMPAGYEKTVLWARDGIASTTVTFSEACLRGVDLYGAVYEPIRDGDSTWDHDGVANGQIELAIYENDPFYVEPCR